MDLPTILILVATGVGVGIMAAIVGGAAVIAYPVLIATGLTPQVAAISNITALVPGIILAALSDRSQLPPFNRAFVGMVIASIIGAALGAVLLLLTPDRVFSVLVPLLLGFATLLFAFAGRISTWLRSRAAQRGHEITFSLTSLKMLLPVSFYGGYFGAGVGVLLLGVFALATGGDYRSANVTKNLVSGLNGLSAAVVFAAKGAVVWPHTLALMAGTVVGGLIGAYVARRIPHNVMRVVVVVIGAALTIDFARQYWF
jgi:uncharacterized membrane protein YfcA